MECAEANATLTNYSITIPEGVSYLIVQSNRLNTLRLKEYSNTDRYNILPFDSRFDMNSDFDDEEKRVGIFELRYKDNDNFIEQIIEDDLTLYQITLNSNSGNNPAIWALYSLPEDFLGRYRVSFYIDNTNIVRFMIGNRNNIINIPARTKGYFETEFTVDSWEYDDHRIMLFAADSTTFKISDMCIEYLDMGIQVTKLISESGIDSAESIIMPLKNCSYKIAALERGENTQCIIGLLGDSWTQHSGADYLPNHTNYVEPLTLYFRKKYGNAGGGFYSFSISGGRVSKMGCAVPSGAFDERSTDNSQYADTITYRDQVEGTHWIDAADATFHTGAYLNLHIEAPHNRFVIHFYGDRNSGSFMYQLDEENAVTVNASNYNGPSTIIINTRLDKHLLKINNVSGDVMIYGVDMQRTTPGVRVHKLGNKGATTEDFTIVNTSVWKTNVESLNLDTMTILLGTNDGPSATETVYENLQTIIDNVKEVNPYIDIAIIQPSNTPNRDMSNQAIYERKLAMANNLPFINLTDVFGTPAQITEKGTFYDSLHPTIIGGRMIADYLEQTLFKCDETNGLGGMAYIDDAPSTGVEYVRKNGAWSPSSGGGGGGSAEWSYIGGNIEDQADLADALDDKQDVLAWDSRPTAGSDNQVTSGAVYTALSGKADLSDLNNLANVVALKANSASPSFTGTPTFDNATAWLTALGFSDSGWLALPNTSSAYTGTIRYRSFGPFVFVNAYQIKLKTELTDSVILLDNLPEDYRPQYSIVVYAGNPTNPAMVTISSNSNIQFFKGTAATWDTNSNIYFTAIFFKA